MARPGALGRLVDPQEMARAKSLYPARAVLPMRRAGSPIEVDLLSGMPDWEYLWDDQGEEGACCAFSSSIALTRWDRVRLAAGHLYREAQKVDEWAGTPHEGTSVRAVCEVLTKGHWELDGEVGPYQEPTKAQDPALGIKEYRWAATVDEMRVWLSTGHPCVVGCDWYTQFDRPQKAKGIPFPLIGADGHGKPLPVEKLGTVRGGHAWCILGCSDKHQVFIATNSWGRGFPRKWGIPYGTLGNTLMARGGAEVALLIQDHGVAPPAKT